MKDDRRWYVLVDETPVCRDSPLEYWEACILFRSLIETDDPNQLVEIRQCTDEDLEWANNL